MTDDRLLDRLEAIEEIRTLKALYCRWADRGYDTAGDDAARFAALFVEDAVWTGGRSAAAVGPAEIEERFASFRPFGFHFLTNGIIEVDLDAGRAAARWSALAPSTEHDGTALWIAGTYDDELVSTPDGWRFARVTFSPALRTPYADGWGKTRFVA
jgi:ketosteroid isomerase-like protein